MTVEVVRAPIIYNVRLYGATGDGVTNDRTAIQAAINAAVAAGGGTVFFPKGTYKVQVATSGWPGSATLTYANAAAYMGLTINGDHITIQGSPGAKIVLYAYGGDPDTNWYVASDATYSIWRGSAFFVTGGSTYNARRVNTQFRGLEIDGGYTYTGVNTYPPNTGTGDGWDLSHRAITFQADKYRDDVLIDDCTFYNFAGEIVYIGGGDAGTTPVNGKITITNSRIHDTNGDGISLGGRQVEIANNSIYTCGACAIENAADDGRHWIHHNRVKGCGLAAIALVGYNGGIGGYDVHHNTVEATTTVGIALYSAWNSKVHDNTIVDAGTGSIQLQVTSGYPNDWIQDVDVYNNLILADTVSGTTGINLGMDVGESKRNRIFGNRVTRTKYAEDNGFAVAEPLADYPGTEHDSIEIFDNFWFGTFADTRTSYTYNQLLTTTGITTVASRKPSVEGAFSVGIAYRVITGVTNVTISITTVDGGGAVTYAVLPITATAVGSYSLPAYVVPADQRATVAVKVTAGTANQVYVTASIREA